ncbi:hypothetical protein, partial [Aquifex pyrophilus]
MKKVVVRIQRIKFKNLKLALIHRLGKNADENTVEELALYLRKLETDEGKRNLRKNASLVEFVLAFEELLNKQEIQEELDKFFYAVQKVTGIPAREKSLTFFHTK